MPSPERLPLIIGGVLVLALIAWFFLNRPAASPEDFISTATTTSTVATTTPTAATTTTVAPKKQKTLPPELPFVLPPGATAIDGYAYVENNSVYFRSLTGKAPLHVWDAKASTFHRVGSFMTYPGTAIVSDCGAAPLYTYYTDNKRLYFYQVWRTPTFRSSTVEAVPNIQATDFTVTGPRESTDGITLFEVNYRPPTTATSTCRLYLSRTML